MATLIRGVRRQSTKAIKALIEEEFHATLSGKLINVTEHAERCCDIWPYVRLAQQSVALPPAVVDRELVEVIYRSENARFDHVLLPTVRHNNFVAIVVDRTSRSVLGHHMLDLNSLYGLDENGQLKNEA